MTANKEAQSANIKKFIVYSNRGSGSCDVSTGVVLFDYYESVLEHTITVSTTIIDTGNAPGSKTVLEGLKLSGFEKVELEFEDNYGNVLKFDELYISKIRNIFSDRQNAVFTLDIVSKEFLTNQFTNSEVYRRFDGEISESVMRILRDNIKTDKIIDVDTTVNKYNFIGGGKKPFKLATEVAKLSVPSGSSGTSAGYFLFETYDGFKFKSIDKLFEQEPVAKYIFNGTTLLPPGYDAKILRYDASKTIDVMSNLVMGSYESKIETFDPYTDKFRTTKQLSSEQQEELGGLESPKLGEGFEGATRRSYKRMDVGHLPEPANNSNSQLQKATKENLDSNNVLIQSSMRYNQVFTLVLSIVIPGDCSLRAGDLVFCDFPEQGEKETIMADKELSGIYMISDICFHITPSSTLTKMNLVRDSFGRKPR
jgi:hypothetical protein